jgi:1-phosphatidylinositol phosphodiesterase
MAISSFTIKDKNYDPKSWMERLANNKFLSEITIPGTHDTVASSSIVSAAKCQDLSTTAQLNAGIRFLDIRCRMVDNKLLLFHGIVPQGGDLQGILDELRNFLSINKSETILMSLKNEGSNDLDFANVFIKEYLRNNSDLFYRQDYIPKLSEVRGKIVLVQRFSSPSDPTDPSLRGLDLSSGWQDNKDNINISYSNGGGKQEFAIQDFYDTDDVEKKWKYVENMLNTAKADSSLKMYINFTSAVGSSKLLNLINLPDPEKMANKINEKLSDFFKKASRARYGCILMDFPSPELIDAIIATNEFSNK